MRVGEGELMLPRSGDTRDGPHMPLRPQLEPVYHKAFSSFEGVSVLLFRPGSVAVTASLVFGGHAPGPSARDVLWPLYCAVKAAGQMLGNLSLDDSSLASDGSNLTDLALETIIIRLTAMRPFSPQLLVPSSILSVLLGKQILQQVTPTVSRFCKVDPLEGPLLLFSNADQWVGIYIEYKFQTPIGTRRQGLANHLARNILDQPFTTALKDKTSPESQELRGMLTRWVRLWAKGREEQETRASWRGPNKALVEL
ncbi:hypothetical protein HPG69_001687 [Diceros bicornis minor]|uniref:Uncharacterized protein n=1 Tax=Diceros bicornis minor TaxID=77932 RepID=A0A7J7FB10_DICBM|nr:hypothetical protein HPG69_001687 [Diceros bicornis minor]